MVAGCFLLKGGLMTSRRMVIPIIAAFLSLAAAGPALGELPTIGFETVDRGFVAADGAATHPKRTFLVQHLSSEAFVDLDSIVLAVFYQRSFDEQGSGPGIMSVSRVGKVKASAVLVKRDSSRHRLGYVRAKVRAADDEVEALKLVDLPVAIDRGDLVEWTVRMKGFRAIPEDDVCAVNPGLAHPGMLED
jgi:hypothetical protein